MSLSGDGRKLLGGGKRKGREQTRANGLTIAHTETEKKTMRRSKLNKRMREMKRGCRCNKWAHRDQRGERSRGRING